MLWEQMTGFVASILIGVMAVGGIVGIARVVSDAPDWTPTVAVGATLALVALFVVGLSAAGTAGSETVSNPYW